MSAELQYNIKYSQLNFNIFNRVQWVKNNTVSFYRETVESKYTLEVDLRNYLTRLLSPADFDSINYYRSRIERLEQQDDLDSANERRVEMNDLYDADSLSAFDEAGGSFSKYMELVGEKFLEGLDEYELGDENIFVETWL